MEVLHLKIVYYVVKLFADGSHANTIQKQPKTFTSDHVQFILSIVGNPATTGNLIWDE